MNIQGFLLEYGISNSITGKNVGLGWVGVDCPFCGDTGQHGGFNLQHGGWSCWKCATKHNTRSAIKELTGVSWNKVSQIMKDYFSGYGVNLIEEPEDKVPFEYPGNNDIPQQMIEYIESRGFDPDYIIKYYKLGWGGLNGFYALRMMIPVYFNNRIVSYQGRDITGSADIRYKDCRKKEAILYHKNILYNLDNCKENWCIVVEGVTDVWALGDNACATFGTGFTPQQVTVLADFFDKVIVWYDPGVESQLVAHSLASRLGVLGVKVKIFAIEGVKDVAELPKHDVENFKSLMEGWGAKMSEQFVDFKAAMQKQFESMLEGQDQLFVTDIEKDEIWEKYLDSFPEGTNEIYRERREYDCSACRQFLRPYGNIVTIKDNELVSIWDIPDLEYPFNVVAKELSSLVKSMPIKNVFITKFAKLGITHNHEQLKDASVKVWEHLYFKLPKKYVIKSTDSIESLQAPFRDSKNVFKRSMEELTVDAGQTILELINQGSLYRGEESKNVVELFIKYKMEYATLIPEEYHDTWCWHYSFNNPVVRIRNTAIGTLLIDLSEGLDLDTAVTKFESIMAPTNYKRPKAIFTKRMVEEAEKKIDELGFSESLGRQFAVLEDITVNNVLFVNRDAKQKINGSVFDGLKDEVPENSKKFYNVAELGIEDFIKNVVPTATNIELLMESKHNSNLMSLIAPADKTSKSMFKWNNGFSWTYTGDIADSMKQNVKAAGGNVEGVLRFSIQWNAGDNNQNDFDAHCIEPGGNKIYFQRKRNMFTGGNLDVDIVSPGDEVAVENITWPDIDMMEEGRYRFLVHNYSHNGGTTGFTAEIEYAGQIYSYEYSKELRQNETVHVAEIEFSKQDGIKFISSLDSSVSSKEIWGINTNKFSKVSVCMASPNYWDDQKSNGNKHYFFFMEGCKSDTLPRGFLNEHLNNDLMEHKKVFEALGSKLRVEHSDNQLSGLGFSTTQRNSIIAKIDGSFSRVIKIIF